MTTTLTSGREAYRRFAWEEASSALAEADKEEPLGPADLELLATSYWWSGRIDDTVEALERAYAGYQEAGDSSAAALVALQLSELAYKRRNMSVGGGWLARAQRLLDAEPESVAHAWLEFVLATEAYKKSELDTAMEHSERALELAQRHGSREVASLALNAEGQMLLRKGRWAEGLALIDEATTAAVSGELEPKTACDVYCMTIAACRDLADYRRAGEWIDEADRWMQRRALRGYQGICRVHRAELKRLRGSWPEAEREALLACDELEDYHLVGAAGFAHYEVGVVRLQMGDLLAAEEAFERAHMHGRNPQPGMSLLLLAQGKVDEARNSLKRSLSSGTATPGSAEDQLRRAYFLPAFVEVSLAAGDLDDARVATEELESIADTYESVVLKAHAASSRGALQLAEKNLTDAAATLDRAWRLLLEAELPYESARSRMLLGQTLAAMGEQAIARLELRAARATFQRLGATVGLQRVNELLHEEGAPSDSARERITKTFMFTDIVTSTDLVGLIGDRAWDELIAWHDRALRTEIARHSGEVVRHTGDGFFIAFDHAKNAIACAVAIQRRLTEHRHTQGFAPIVRIGMHTTEASRQGSDFSGLGVVQAARIGALAQGEEILVSNETVAAAGTIPVQVSEPKAVELKGIEGKVEVRAVSWR